MPRRPSCCAPPAPYRFNAPLRRPFCCSATHWDAATGFYLNGQHTKILGMANHEDFAGVGVGVSDRLQVRQQA